MIDIHLINQDWDVIVCGHAGTAPKGEDLLCAAVSGLVLALAETVKQYEQRGWLKNSAVRLRDGEARFRFKPYDAHGAEVWGTWFTVLSGLQVLQKMYPDRIRFVF